MMNPTEIRAVRGLRNGHPAAHSPTSVSDGPWTGDEGDRGQPIRVRAARRETAIPFLLSQRNMG